VRARFLEVKNPQILQSLAYLNGMVDGKGTIDVY